MGPVHWKFLAEIGFIDSNFWDHSNDMGISCEKINRFINHIVPSPWRRVSVVLCVSHGTN